MSKEFFILPYKAASKGAILLSEKLDCYRINTTNSNFRRADNRIIINWGRGDRLPTEVAACPIILNKPEAVCKAIDKRLAFEAFINNRVMCPEYTTNRLTAQQWVNSGYFVFARTLAEGADGAGIKVLHLTAERTRLEVPSASFYTKGVVGQTTEYRVNVFKDECISYQKKVKVSGRDDHDPLVRTTEGGWGFEVVEQHSVPSRVDAEAVAAVNALGLDFGGVDVICLSGGIVRVLEVNTAPHLTDYSATKLANALNEWKDELSNE